MSKLPIAIAILVATLGCSNQDTAPAPQGPLSFGPGIRGIWSGTIHDVGGNIRHENPNRNFFIVYTANHDSVEIHGLYEIYDGQKRTSPVIKAIQQDHNILIPRQLLIDKIYLRYGMYVEGQATLDTMTDLTFTIEESFSGENPPQSNRYSSRASLICESLDCPNYVRPEFLGSHHFRGYRTERRMALTNGYEWVRYEIQYDYVIEGNSPPLEVGYTKQHTFVTQGKLFVARDYLGNYPGLIRYKDGKLHLYYMYQNEPWTLYYDTLVAD